MKSLQNAGSLTRRNREGGGVTGRKAGPLGCRERERRLRQALRQAAQVTPARVSFPGVEVRARSEAAGGAPVGGDFCDVFPLGGGKVALVLGDVCGHGLDAARHVPEIKFALRAFLSRDPSPGRALACANDWLCLDRGLATAPAAPLIAATAVVLQGRTGLGVCARAGADAPLLLRPLDRPIRLGTPGMALGISAGQVFEDRAFPLAFGDLLLLTTDGITEARRDGCFLGASGAARLAMDAWWSDGSAGRPAVCPAVLEGARRFAGGVFRDDASVLTVYRVPD